DEDFDDRDSARGVRDGAAALRARGLSGACRLCQEHDHGGGADGRGDIGGECGGWADAADAGTHSAGAAGGGALHCGVFEQGGQGGRQGVVGFGGAGGAVVAEQVRVSGGQDTDRVGVGDQGVGGGSEHAGAAGGSEASGGGGPGGDGAGGAGEGGGGGGDGGGEAGEQHAAQEVQGGGVRADEGGGGPAHAVFQWVSATVLLSDDGRDGGGGVDAGGGDGDAGGQCAADGGADCADCDGSGAAACDSGGGQDGGLGGGHGNRR